MPLDPNVLRAMKQIARMMPDQIDEMLRNLATQSPEEWRQGTNLILLTLWARTTNILKILQGAVAQANGEAPAAAAPEAPLIGGDGAPITDPAQIEAERLMNASAGPRGGAVPPGPAPRPRPAAVQPIAPPNGGVRIGGDGQPITDPEQLEAERILDEVAGPR